MATTNDDSDDDDHADRNDDDTGDETDDTKADVGVATAVPRKDHQTVTDGVVDRTVARAGADDTTTAATANNAAAAFTAFEFHYYVFNLLFMVGFLLHCRKYIDWNGVITIVHIVVFIRSSSSAAAAASASSSSSSSAAAAAVAAAAAAKGTQASATPSTASVAAFVRDTTFFSFLVFVIYTTIDTAPHNANHHNVMGFISVVLLPQQWQRGWNTFHNLIPSSRSTTLVRKPATRTHPQWRIATTARTIHSLNVVRMTVIIMYFMAGFHKLNADFLYHRDVSCAYDMMWKYLPLLGVHEYDELYEENGATTTRPWIPYVPYLAVAVELVAPLFLLVPNGIFQRTGIQTLLSLHLLLLPIGFADFGSIAQSLLWLFIPPSALQTTYSSNSNNNNNSSNNNNNNNSNSNLFLSRNYFNDMALCLCCLEMASIVTTRVLEYEDPPMLKQEQGMVLLGFFIMWSHVFRGTGTGTATNTNTASSHANTTTNPNNRNTSSPFVRVYVPTSVWSLFGLSVFIVYTLNPYLGLKTTGCLNMFSNLRTVGTDGGNHLIFGTRTSNHKNRINLKWWTFQEDVVTILDWNEMTEYYFNGRHEYLEEENNDQEEVEDDDAYKLGWSYHKLGFDHTMWKHLSNQSYYYQVEYGFDYHQDEDTDDGTEGDAVAEGNEEYINYQIRRLWNDGNYYIGTVVTSIAPRFTDDNVLVRTVAYADGDKDIADEKQLREWKYTTVNDDDDEDDSERITRPHGLYLQIKYDNTIFETDDLLYDTIFYTLFVRNEAPWYMYKYFDFRDIQPIDQPHQECAW